WAGQGRALDQQNKSYPKPLIPPPPHVLPGLCRHMDLRQLVERIVISPEAEDARMKEVKTLVWAAGLPVPVDKSGLCGYPSLITNLDDILKFAEQARGAIGRLPPARMSPPLPLVFLPKR